MEVGNTKKRSSLTIDIEIYTCDDGVEYCVTVVTACQCICDVCLLGLNWSLKTQND